MKSQKSSSLIVTDQIATKSVQNAPNCQDNPSVFQQGIQSENLLSQPSRPKRRVPDFMKEILRQNVQHSESSRSQKDGKKINRSLIGSMVLNSIKKMRNIVTCQICECSIKANLKRLNTFQCEHNSNFCQSCLHHYIVYKVQRFEEVQCPRDGCNVLLNTKDAFFSQLPIEVQKKYTKLHQFYQTANEPNKRLCPKQNCQGIICMNPDQLMVCNICQTEFCSKCLLVNHEGECDKKQIQFFQNSLHYRQCKSCKFVVEKLIGCNHMTCRCGHQFCYVCGADWNQAHYGTHDQNGNLAGDAAVPEPQCCTCCEQICGQTCACIFKIPLKILLFLLLLLLMVFTFVSRDIFVMMAMLVASLFAGIFGYSFAYLCQLDAPFCILGVLLFPLCMIAGVGIAFREIFCPVVSEMFEEERVNYGQALTDVCQF